MNILVINGPNLNLLGERSSDIYGTKTLKEIEKEMRSAAKGNKIKFFQRNGEGEIINIIHKHIKWADWMIINPGAYTHYSYAIRDAIEVCKIKTVEVHLSDISKREAFRKKSVIKDVCKKQIKGLKEKSYIKALEFCISNGKK
ncbi:MAG: 3-dehydroquinate dehydratase [Elusimicrobia bacterium]|nr:3-dehydroquinate dehydratase [Elusimicrobiota bacterium]